MSVKAVNVLFQNKYVNIIKFGVIISQRHYYLFVCVYVGLA